MTYEKVTYSLHWHDLLHAVQGDVRRYPTLTNLWAWVICRLLMKYLSNPYFGSIQGCDINDKMAIAKFGRKMYQMLIEGVGAQIKRLECGGRLDRLVLWIIRHWLQPTIQEIKESMNYSLSAYVLDTSSN